MNRVVLTGAAGTIGSSLRQHLTGRYPVLRLSDAARLGPPRPGEEIDRTDITDLTAAERMLAGTDAVVHLGAVAAEGDWPAILQANIIGTYNIFEAARRQGVGRVVFASSNHAIGFYRRDQRIDHRVPVRPDSRYGVSKALGEALGSYYADKFGLAVFCIRIGNMTERPVDKRRLSIWISPRDLAQLVRIGLDHPGLHFEIVYGVSANRRSWWDNANAERMGYRPQDDGEDYAGEVLAREAQMTPDPVAERFQGGTFCAEEFAGDAGRVP